MIYVNLHGNIGNQLFIYAMARKIQKITNQNIIICVHDMQKYFNHYKYDLDQFRLCNNISIDKNFKFPSIINDRTIKNKLITKLMKKSSIVRSYAKIKALMLSRRGYFYWMGEEFLDIEIPSCKNYFLNGFWQAPKYFNDIRDDLLNEIKPNSIENIDKQLLQIIENNESICVSVRRGDYVTDKKIKNQYHVYEDDYYIKGVNYIKTHCKKPVVICFSDDISWVKKNLNFNCPTYYESGKNTVCEKLFMMSKCKYFVLSNSTFSWWAEYLSDYDEKIVVAPLNWYADGRPDNISQNYWHRI